MKNKYRIEKCDDKFFPQYKNFFGWSYYLDECSLWEALGFDSFEEANRFLINKKTQKNSKSIYYNLKD